MGGGDLLSPVLLRRDSRIAATGMTHVPRPPVPLDLKWARYAGYIVGSSVMIMAWLMQPGLAGNALFFMGAAAFVLGLILHGLSGTRWEVASPAVLVAGALAAVSIKVRYAPFAPGSSDVALPMLVMVLGFLLLRAKAAVVFAVVTFALQAATATHVGADAPRWALLYLGMATLVGAFAFARERAAVERDALMDDLQASTMRVRGLLDGAPIAVAAVDGKGCVTLANATFQDACKKVLGKRWIEGEPLGAYLPDDIKINIGSMISEASRGSVVRGQWELDVGGHRRRIETTCAPGAGDDVLFMARQIVDEEELRASHRQALHEARLGLLNVANHDLRTPLTPLRMEVALLASGKAGELTPRQKHIVDVMQRNLIRLEHHIDQILYANRIEQGHIAATATRFSLTPVLQQAVEAGRSERRDDVAVVFRPRIESEIDNDPSLVRDALTFLVMNAVRHAPAGTEVHVELEVDDGEVEVHVSDDGPGVEVDALEEAEPFHEDAAIGDPRRHGLPIFLANAILQHCRSRVEACNGHGNACFKARFEALATMAAVPEGTPLDPVRP